MKTDMSTDLSTGMSADLRCDLTPADIGRLDFGKGAGLLPAVVQDAVTGAVLMLGYMSPEALAATFERGRVVFHSRSKGRLWEKGETSGHRLELVRIRTDCDADALLVLARPQGPVCHEGTRSCFGDRPGAAAEALGFLPQLEGIVERRLAEAPEGSYTARLHAAGPRRIAQKVGEEGLEVALAAVSGTDEELIGECADLVFHLLVLLRGRGLGLARVAGELALRHAARTESPA
jgi:phosphoribosyl-ATP pyrophosphohydrolase/phosphoribosyl-AMP cyclohydrolase